jgi:hypothetical protein
MPIYAENTGTNFTPMESGAYAARCYSMIQIGTVMENIMGEDKLLHKVRLTFEFPTELKVFKEENGEQPYVISKEFTLSMHEKASLRKFLESWRGKNFTEEEAKKFDITVLLEKQCLINVIHHTAKNGNVYAQIGGVSPLPKGMTCPPLINKAVVLSYDNFDYDVFESLPDFLKDKIKTSKEYQKLKSPNELHSQEAVNVYDTSDLPF